MVVGRWAVAPTGLIEGISVHRDYDTISVGMIDDHFATLALEHGEKLLARSRDMTARNRVLLDEWIAHEPRISWVRPRSGTTAFLEYDLDMPSRELCVSVVKETGTMFTPGSALGVEGFIRIGYANSTDIIAEGLERFSAWLETQ